MQTAVSTVPFEATVQNKVEVPFGGAFLLKKKKT